MRKQFEFSEEDLYLAAREAEQFIRAQYPDAQTCPPHTFSPAFEADMQQLFAQLQNGTLKTSAARLGWPYYLRRSIAAILLCFLLACATMPEAVLAGYQKLIEVVEHVFEEYTQSYFDSNTNIAMDFKPFELGYLPDGLEISKKEENRNSLNLLYTCEDGRYFKIKQKLITKNNNITYDLDTEGAMVELIVIKNEVAKFVYKSNEIRFVWLQGSYRISGQSNLPKETIIEILDQIVV